MVTVLPEAKEQGSEDTAFLFQLLHYKQVLFSWST